MQHIAIFSLLLAPLVMLLALGANHPELDKLLRDGDAALSRRDAQGALVSFIRALELDDNIFALQGLAMCYGHLGRLVQSAEMWTRAAAKQPTSNELKYNAGMAYLHLGRVQQALEYLEACQKFRPALIKLASIYRDVGDSEAVQRQLRAAMALEPGNPDAYSYMGDTYNNLKQFELAIGMYERALKLIDDQQKQQQQGGQPRPPPLTEIITLLKHIGDAYMNTKAPDKAISYYRRALGFSHPRYRLPPYALAGPLVGHFFAAGEIGFWRDMEKDQAQIISLAKQSSLQGSRVSDISPYHMLFLAEPAVALGVAASWSRELVRIERQLQRAPISLPPFSLPGACSRAAFSLGYLSRRFHDYPGTQLMLELFAAHNRTAVCTYSFAYGPDDSSDYRSIVAKSSDFFADVTFNTTHAAAAVIKNTGVQVLFDYDGMHDFNSLGLLAHRPAAVHITWLGFASTTGQGRRRGAAHLDTSNTNPNPNPNPILRKPHGDAIDFLLADRHVLPPDHASPDTVSERLLYLPTYQPQSLLSDERTALDVSAETPAQRAAQRRQLCLNHPPIEAPPSGALEQQALWLCSFNRMGKMTPGLFQTAMDLRRAAPRAYLVMMAESREATRELQLTALHHGIHPQRILLFPRLPKPTYKLVLRLSDLFIDTRTYNSHTVASDALIQGLPVLTLPGHTFASRVALSLSHAVGLSTELAATSEKRWADTALGLLQHSHVRSSLRHRIVTAARGRCLGNSTKFAGWLERAAAATLEMRRHEPEWAVHHAWLEASCSSTCSQ